MDFLEKLDFLMERDGLNKKTLSEKSGVPYTTIDGLYKKGYGNAKLGTIRKLADCLGVTLDYLMIDNISDVNYGKMHSKFNYDINQLTDKQLLVAEKYEEAPNEIQKAIDKILDIPEG